MAAGPTGPMSEASPAVGAVRFGDLDRTEPVSRHFGGDRGTPIDRHYIEDFLARHAGDVAGRVLEIGDDGYTRRFGAGRVEHSDVLDLKRDNPAATIVADLTSAPQIASGSFDCIIITQTLQMIFDIRAAMSTLARVLKPGGVILATVPGISQSDFSAETDVWQWSVMPPAARRLFAEALPGGVVEVEAHGNVLTATGFLQGLALEELPPSALERDDPCFPLIVTVRAVKAP